MGILITATRSTPAAREFLRFEGLMGRFVQLNLLPLSWCERMMQVEYDEENRIYEWLLKEILTKNPYQADLTIAQLFPDS